MHRYVDRTSGSGATSGSDVGSVLVEALVGIGMLVIITTSLLTFSRGWLAASEASHARSVGLALAAAHLAGEVLADGALEPARVSSGHPVLTSTITGWTSTQGDAPRCGVPDPGPSSGPVVTVTRPSAAQPHVLRLFATRVETPRLRIKERADAIAPGSLLIEGVGTHDRSFLIDTGDQQSLATTDGSGCLSLPMLPPGRHVLRPSDGGEAPDLIDESHLTGAALRLERSTLDRPSVGSWALSEPARVRVDVDLSGARPADVVIPSGLRWLVRGDDRRIATDLGTMRPLHPGPMTLVVTACANPEASGSSTSVDVVAGQDMDAVIPLAIVTLDGLVGRDDEAITAERVTGCADGSGRIPVLRWERGLVDGMRIALPHGAWDVSVQGIDATPSNPVVVHAGEPDVRVSVP